MIIIIIIIIITIVVIVLRMKIGLVMKAENKGDDIPKYLLSVLTDYIFLLDLFPFQFVKLRIKMPHMTKHLINRLTPNTWPFGGDAQKKKKNDRWRKKRKESELSGLLHPSWLMSAVKWPMFGRAVK